MSRTPTALCIDTGLARESCMEEGGTAQHRTPTALCIDTGLARESCREEGGTAQHRTLKGNQRQIAWFRHQKGFIRPSVPGSLDTLQSIIVTGHKHIHVYVYKITM